MRNIFIQIRTNGETELIFKSGDRYQACSFDPLSSKSVLVDRLHDLAERIANDEEFK